MMSDNEFDIRDGFLTKEDKVNSITDARERLEKGEELIPYPNRVHREEGDIKCEFGNSGKETSGTDPKPFKGIVVGGEKIPFGDDVHDVMNVPGSREILRREMPNAIMHMLVVASTKSDYRVRVSYDPLDGNVDYFMKFHNEKMSQEQVMNAIENLGEYSVNGYISSLVSIFNTIIENNMPMDFEYLHNERLDMFSFKTSDKLFKESLSDKFKWNGPDHAVLVTEKNGFVASDELEMLNNKLNKKNKLNI